MCTGDDKNCPEFELHHRKLKETLDRERRSFLRSSFAAAGGAAAMTAGGISLVTPQMAAAAEKNQPAKRSYHHLPANADTVHWGYFSKKLKPQVEIDSGDFITIEALTHHANDDAERSPRWLMEIGAFTRSSRKISLPVARPDPQYQLGRSGSTLAASRCRSGATRRCPRWVLAV